MKLESTNKAESFYIAIIIYKSSPDQHDYQPLYQESFVLMKATSLESAKEKALNHGKNESVSYTNENGETITWSLHQVVDNTNWQSNNSCTKFKSRKNCKYSCC